MAIAFGNFCQNMAFSARAVAKNMQGYFSINVVETEQNLLRHLLYADALHIPQIGK